LDDKVPISIDLDAAFENEKLPQLPPALIRMVAEQIPNSEVVIVHEAGHSSYWEQPEAFNRAVLGFLARHSK
jgi:pimeloyl-ACP methyl ester carboxylesterase